MGLRDLSLGEMVAITSQWVGADRKTFQSIPEAAGLYPRVEEAHNGVLSAQKVAAPADLDGLIEKARSLDVRHDAFVRALYYIPEGAAAYLRALEPPKEDEAAALLAARDALLPEGLATAKQTYLAEAGNAERALALVEGALEKTLKQHPVVRGVSLLDVVNLWGEVAAELGTTEHQKARVQADARPGAKTVSTTSQAVVGARNRWIQVVNTVMGNLDLSGAPTSAVEMIRAPVLAAIERAAARRSKGGKGGTGGGETGAGTGTGGTGDGNTGTGGTQKAGG